jgi:hypothetical protein
VKRWPRGILPYFDAYIVGGPLELVGTAMEAMATLTIGTVEVGAHA